VTDPETDKSFCEFCGLLLPEGPVPIGSRLVPPEEFLRRAAIKCQELDHEILLSQQRKHQLLSVAAKVRDIRCRWQAARFLRPAVDRMLILRPPKTAEALLRADGTFLSATTNSKRRLPGA